MRKSKIAVLTLSVFFAGHTLSRQARAQTTDFLTEGFDSERTGYLPAEHIITAKNAASIRMLWKTKLDSKPREMHNLFAPLIASQVKTSSGLKQIAIVAGISDDLFGLDAVTGELLWSKHFPAVGLTGAGPQSGTLCPTGQTAVPTIQKLPDGSYKVWALAGDGRIWQIDAATGQEMAQPEKFVPPAGKAYALNLAGDYIYTVQAQGCGGITYQMDAFNIKTHRTTALYPGGGGMWGRRGVMVDPEGRSYQGTGDGPYDPANKQLGNVLIQAAMGSDNLLHIIGWYAPPDVGYMYKHDLDMNVTPLALDYKGHKFAIATSKECRMWLLDRDNYGGGDKADHREALDRTGLACNDRQQYDGNGVWGATAAYVDSKGDAWFYAPFWGRKSETFNPPIMQKPDAVEGGVAAYQVAQVNGQWKLVPKWLSQNMRIAEEALIANDLVFTYASGENAMQSVEERAWDQKPVTGSRIEKSTHATIYVLDAHSGKTLWSSGDQVSSFNHFSGITVANGKIYLGTYDGTMYCFGIAQ